MSERFINKSTYSIDEIFDRYDLSNILTINNYPVLAVVWNLFLLIIPYYLAILLRKYWLLNKFKKLPQKIVALFLGFLWIIFIPNTVYIISDIRHINNYCPFYSYSAACPENAWLLAFFFFYAIVGWIAYVYLLNQMRNLLIDVFNKKTAKILTISAIPAISLGLLLGLVNRWNSWEIFISPLEIINNITIYFTNFVYFKNWLIITVFLYLLYWVGNYLFKEKINLYGLFKNR